MMGKDQGRFSICVRCCLFVVYLLRNVGHSSAEFAFKLPPVNYSLADAVRTDVKYHVFTNRTGGTYTDETDVPNLSLNPNRPLKILVHGWLSNETTYWYEPLKNEYFAKNDERTVVLIDWSKAGSKELEISIANAKPAGYFLADFILASGVELEGVHIIGHSLGSHVAGFAGKRIYAKTGRKIGRITGLDPGGPTFEHEDVGEDGRLAKGDAEFLDVVHTDVGYYGFGAPLGDLDFYPNGGAFQPGCPPHDVDDNCSHARSNLYFIESVNSDAFKAAHCGSWDDYSGGKCNGSETIVFGENAPRDAKGVYYFATHSKPPFATVPS